MEASRSVVDQWPINTVHCDDEVDSGDDDFDPDIDDSINGIGKRFIDIYFENE